MKTFKCEIRFWYNRENSDGYETWEQATLGTRIAESDTLINLHKEVIRIIDSIEHHWKGHPYVIKVREETKPDSLIVKELFGDLVADIKLQESLF